MGTPAAHPFHASPEAGGEQEDDSQAFALAPHVGLSPLSRALGGDPAGDGLLGRALVGGLLAGVGEEEAGVGVEGDFAPGSSTGASFP